MNVCVNPAAILPAPIAFTLDQQPLQARAGETILQAARRHGVEIPHLCCRDGLRPAGNCRACVVEIEGERALAASCCRSVTPGMVVQTDSERARKSQQMVLELLLSDLPEVGYKWNDGGDTSGAAALGDAPRSSDASSTSSPGASPSTAGSVDASAVGQHGELSAWAARLGVRVRPALAALRRTAHTVKGLFATFGVQEPQDLANSLEQAALDGNQAHCQSTVPQVCARTLALAEALRAYKS